MKKLKIFLLLLLAIFLICCQKEEINISNFDEYMPNDSSKNISMVMKELDINKFTLDINNSSENNYMFGNYYTIFKLENDKWYEINDLPPFEDIAFEIKSHDNFEHNYYFSDTLLSENGDGIYRMRKEFNKINLDDNTYSNENIEYSDVIFKLIEDFE